MKYIVQPVNEEVPAGVTRVAPFISEWAANYAAQNDPESYEYETVEQARLSQYTGFLLIPLEEEV